jgi:hypothetical protein
MKDIQYMGIGPQIEEGEEAPRWCDFVEAKRARVLREHVAKPDQPSEGDQVAKQSGGAVAPQLNGAVPEGMCGITCDIVAGKVTLHFYNSTKAQAHVDRLFDGLAARRGA